MSKPIPTGNFTFLDRSEIDTIAEQIRTNTYKLSKSKGFVFEVDIEYPRHLHDSHNDYPFLPEKLVVNDHTKLIPNLNNKKHYILNEHNLIQALKHGLILTNIHRILSFNQSNWLKEYIDFNTNLRTKAKNEFEKNFFKLMNNSVFGKTMENIRKRCNIEIPNDSDGKATLKRLNVIISNPNYREPMTVKNSNINVFSYTKTKIFYNKPIYERDQILDLSKTLMYQFHYSYMKTKFKDIQALYSDTDSIIYHIKTGDFYQDIASDIKEWFDSSAYLEPIGGIETGINKKQLGYFKDETGNDIISHFVAKISKSYTYKVNNEERSNNVLKGIVGAVRAKMISFKDYYDCIFNNDMKQVEQTTFERKDHVVKTVTRTKLALESSDNKRFVCDNKVSTLALGHYKIN